MTQSLLDMKSGGIHHWWPKGIQRHWVNSEGQLHRRRQGKIEPKNPKNNHTGCIRNSHRIDFGESPWTHSFEEAFNIVDSKGAVVVSNAVKRIQETRSYKLSRSKFTSWLPFSSKFTDREIECLSVDESRDLARLSISIVLRSPAFQFRNSFGPHAFNPNGDPWPSLGQMNIWQNWSALYQDATLPIEPIGIIFLIANRKNEFVIGDGFYENTIDQITFVKTASNEIRPSYDGEILLPLSPDICALICLNSSFGQRVAILSEDETNDINRITSLSSRNEIYFRHLDFEEFEPNNSNEVRRATLGKHCFLRSLLRKYDME